MQIHPINGLSQLNQSAAISTPGDLGTNAVASGDGASPSEFGKILMGVVQDANENLQNADQALVDFSNGTTDDVQAVVMSTVKADLSFRFILEMRNKLTESYQELSRMQF